MKTMMKILLLVGVLGAIGVACGDNSNNNNNPPDMTMPSLPDLAESPDMAVGCVSNPMTHVEIINACTNADTFDVMPFYPTLAPNGMLPPLP
jgi:hypothetical protein